jgi:hypothetical protein
VVCDGVCVCVCVWCGVRVYCLLIILALVADLWGIPELLWNYSASLGFLSLLSSSLGVMPLNIGL